MVLSLCRSATLTPVTDRISAYETFGQSLAGTLTLADEGDQPLDLALNAWASDDRWVMQPTEPRVVVVPAGGSTAVPLTVLVPPDAWADVATRLACPGDERLWPDASGVDGRDARPRRRPGRAVPGMAPARPAARRP